MAHKYKVGDLFQAKTGFIGDWIDNKVFVLSNINTDSFKDAYVLYCQENGRTLKTTLFTIERDMVKIG